MDAEALIGRAWPQIRDQAHTFAAEAPEPFDAAVGLYTHPAWEVRFFAVIVLGRIAASDRRALEFLYARCGEDGSWQVNEGLAMAFDAYCSACGYERALPEIERWLHAPSANLRRAVSEGLRPWTAKARPYFAANPQAAIDLLGSLIDDESRYVLESTGNALRDIGRKHLPLVLAALRDWLAERPGSRSRRVVARYALERAVKADPSLKQLYE
jgi:3-methyladenine DNA glycosylase AlkC